LFVANSVLSYC